MLQKHWEQENIGFQIYLFFLCLTQSGCRGVTQHINTAKFGSSYQAYIYNVTNITLNLIYDSQFWT